MTLVDARHLRLVRHFPGGPSCAYPYRYPHPILGALRHLVVSPW